jgi:hypothetical protein
MVHITNRKVDESRGLPKVVDVLNIKTMENQVV